MEIRTLFGKKTEEFSKIKKLTTPLHVQLCESGLFESEGDVNTNFDDLVGFVREWLQEQGFKREEALMDFMLEKKSGKFRKDGSPSALHETSQVISFISCIEDSLHHADPAGQIATILSHDLKEDFGIKNQQINDRLFIHGHQYDRNMEIFLENYNTISYHNGDKTQPNYKSKHEYSLALRRLLNAGIGKLFDNTQNASTSIGGHKDPLGYSSKIGLQINSYTQDMRNNFPDHQEILKNLQKVVGKTCRIISHYYNNDFGEPLTLDAHDFPERGFKLPRGLHPYHIARDRVLVRRPELAPAGYDSPQASCHFSDDNPGPSV